MAVRAGYKRTEVGIIPEDWEVRSFAEHFKIYAGGDVPKHSLSNTQSSTHPFPIFANALSNRGLYGYTAERRASADSVTITARGYLGHAEYRSVPFFPIVRLLVLEPTGQLDARFTAFSINELVEFAVESTGVPQLTAPQVGKYSIAAPPTLEEQRAIAAALSDVDALLDGLDRLIAKNRDLKQATMQQLLTGQTRLPGFGGEWEVKLLSEVGDIRSGGTPSTRQPHFWDGDVPWCTPTDITALSGHKYLTTTARKISAAGLQSSSAEVIPARSLIMTSRATIGACAINLTPMTTNQGFKSIVPVAEIDVEFLYYLMTTQESGLVALCGGSTFLEISKKQLSAYEIRLPSHRTEQVAISAVLSDMDAELAALKARRDKTKNLKKAMMQALLTGKTRLVPTGGAHV